MSVAAPSSVATKSTKLSIRKSSILLPLMLLILTVLLFVTYALPSDCGKLAKLFGMESANPSAKDILARAGGLFVSEDPTLRNQFWQNFGFHPLLFIGDVLFPLFKAYLEVLGQDFVDIVQKVTGALGTIALYSLAPGLAGLIYRRQFTYWFLASFLLLLAVNASGLFPKLSIGSDPMPGSGKVLFFLLAQVVVLLVAYRLRRHGPSLVGLPPKIYNWILKALLVVAGVLIYQNWDPLAGSATALEEKALQERKAAADDARAGRADAGVRDCAQTECPGLKLIDHNAAKPFYMGLYEVTHAEWDACTANNSQLCPKKERSIASSNRLPIEVTFDEAKQYAQWLSVQTGATYRLPSTAEWNHAARANAPTGSKWSFGNDQNELIKHGWWGDLGATHARHVGLLKPNAFGLYDTHGNLSEWIDPCRGADGAALADCNTKPKAIGGRLSELPDNLRLDMTPLTGGYSGRSGFRLVRDVGVAAPALPPASAQAAASPPPSSPPPAVTAPASRSATAILTSGFTGLVFKWEVLLLGLPLLYSLFRNSAAWTSKKRKNIVVCLDGTSNTPDQVDQGFAATTNVYKLFRMLKADKQGMFEPGDVLNASLCKRYGDKQIGLYYAGVGNAYDNDPLLGLLGQATGLGAEDAVERAYLDLVRIYRPGDRVFIFGFSRGSAISRLLARAIDARGAPRTAWTIKLFGKHRTIKNSKGKRPMSIDVLGCWDTVGSFGVAKTIGGINLQQLNLFRDLSVPENVRQAYHMVALDERRQEFEPTLMDPDPNRPERIIEVWFAGDHANIGGGWATDRLSDVTLDFLLRRISSGYADSKDAAGAEAWGLHLIAWKADKLDHWKRQDDDPHVVDPDPLGQIQVSFSHVFNYRPRKMPLHAIIHDTVFQRMVTSLPLYAPQSLFDLNDELDRRRDLIDDQVAKLTESNLLSADDLAKIEGYKVKLRLNRFDDYYRERLVPSFSSEYVAKEVALALQPDGSLDADAGNTRVRPAIAGDAAAVHAPAMS